MIYLKTVKAATGFSGGAVIKNLPASAGDADLIPGSGKSPEIGNGNPRQYSCLENSMVRGAWQATVHGIAKNWTLLSTHTQELQAELLFWTLLFSHSVMSDSWQPHELQQSRLLCPSLSL